VDVSVVSCGRSQRTVEGHALKPKMQKTAKKAPRTHNHAVLPPSGGGPIFSVDVVSVGTSSARQAGPSGTGGRWGRCGR
jgi:hypothetical protein